SLGNRTCSIAIGPNESTTRRHSERLESPYSRTAAVTRSAGASISPKSRHTKASPRFSPVSQCQEKVRAELGTRAETPGVSRSSCQMPAVVLAARARNDCAVARSVNSSSEPSRGSKPSRIPAFSSQSVSRGGARTGGDATPGPAPRAGAAVEVAEPVMEAELSEWRPSVHVYPVGAAGQRAWRVQTPASSPAWSPDGRWLAFMSNRSGKRNVWRVGLDGTPAEQLTDVVGELGEFRWSPDGRRLAYLVTDPPAEEELRQVQEKRDARVVGEAYRFARLYRLDLDAAAGR